MFTYVLTFQCPDQPGIIARLSQALYKNDANIVDANQHSHDNQFFLRLIYETQTPEKTTQALKTLAPDFNAKIHIYAQNNRPKMGILVSKTDHCLHEILYLWKAGELNVEIPFIISNHDTHETLAYHYNIPYFHCPGSVQDRKEDLILSYAKGNSDFLVLARYMQILSAQFIDDYAQPIINIHHSFLPSFKGANPYQQAFDKGVKIIGATAHYVTAELDEGPIIAQQVSAVSHRDTPEMLKRKGTSLERDCLIEAISAHIEHRIIPYYNKTIVF